MATEFISNSWLMPTNANAEANRLSNYSLDFDGSTQYISIDPILKNLPSDNFTISAWVKINTLPTGTAEKVLFQELTSASRYVRLCIKGNQNGFVLRYGDGSNLQINGATTITTGVWYNIMLVYSTTGIKLYLNGSEDASASYTSLSRSAFVYAAIGCYYYAGSASSFWDGMITQFSIFDYALSSSQVTQLYGTGSAIGNPMAITNGRKPVAYYPLGNAGFNGEFLVPNSAEQDYVFSFDDSPSNNAIDFGVVNAIENSTSFTLNFWLNPSSFTSPYTLLGTKTGFSGDSAKGIAFDVRSTFLIIYLGDDFSNYARINNPLPLNEWTLLSVVYDGSQSTNADKFKIYYGGTQQTVNTFGGTIPATTPTTGRSLILGKQATGACIETKVSNFSVFDSALPATGTESVESLYNYGTPPNIASWSNLQGWWELDASATFDGSNWSIPDASSNSNTGTSSGMTAANLVQSDLIINAPFDSMSLSFDGTDDYIETSSIDVTGNKSFSFWIKRDSSSPSNDGGILTIVPTSGTSDYISIALWQDYIQVQTSNNTTTRRTVEETISTDVWYHIVVIKSTNSIDNIYINGLNKTLSNFGTWTGAIANPQNKIAEAVFGVTNYNFNGKISNCSIYSSVLSATQVKTLYNDGKPFDLNTFAVTPVSWWRLGSVNSSFDGTNWTVLDEIGTNNGTSANMTQSDLVDGVGATGSGTSSGMSSGTNRTGNAPYSDNNAVSYNMSVTAKSTSVPT